MVKAKANMIFVLFCSEETGLNHSTNTTCNCDILLCFQCSKDCFEFGRIGGDRSILLEKLQIFFLW